MKKLAALLALLLLLPMFSFSQDNAMAYLLVKVGTVWVPGEEAANAGGWPVFVADTNQIQGKQVPPIFCQFVVTDATVEEIQNYLTSWNREIDWEFVGHDYSIDGHRLNVFVKPEFVSQSGLNGLTRDKVEEWLNLWGATVQSISSNSVVFDVTVAGAIASTGFWGIPNMDRFTFTEISYDQLTGVHRTEFNWSGYILDINNLAGKIINNGCTIVSAKPAQKKVTFDCGRDTVFDSFKMAVKDALTRPFQGRKWIILPDAVQASITNGGSIEVTKAQLLPYLRSRLLD
jgi:hypothetical protein